MHALFSQLPFPVLLIQPDNGSEFRNDNLWRFCPQHYPHLKFGRSRPSHPTDNRFVEQKNSSRVRAFLGDRRLDTVTQTRYLNQLYAQMDRYYNCSQPVLHPIEKRWVPAADGHSGYIRRFHDTPRPPVTRLCNAKLLSPAQQQALLAQQAAINPVALLRDIEAGWHPLFAYPGAQTKATKPTMSLRLSPTRNSSPKPVRLSVSRAPKPHSNSQLTRMRRRRL